jgi:hypothetical protein
MQSEQYKSKSGRTLYRPIIDESTSPNEIDGIGFCLACGHESDSFVEPDAERCQCESCGEKLVFGVEQLILLGLVAE